MVSVVIILLIIGLVLELVAAIGYPSSINLMALGLFFWMLAELVSRLPAHALAL